MKRFTTLILNTRQVSRLVDVRKTVTCIERVFKEYSKGRVQMPPKVYLDLKHYSGDFRAMPAYVSVLKACSLKWVNVHSGNKKAGLPTVMAIIILSDPATGFPLCIMDGTHVTNLRTGAAGAVGAKYLARKNSSTVSLVGCGAQAATQLAALSRLFKLKEVRVWGHEKSYIRAFIKKYKGAPFILVPAKSVEDCVEGSDIVVTTTPSRKPLVRYVWLKKGVHINAIGADAKGKQELEPLILKKAKVVIDDWAQASHSGEINVSIRKKIITRRGIYAELGDIISRKKKGRTSQTEITVFDSTGLAIQDTAVAHLIYKTALRRKAGRRTNIVL